MACPSLVEVKLQLFLYIQPVSIRCDKGKNTLPNCFSADKGLVLKWHSGSKVQVLCDSHVRKDPDGTGDSPQGRGLSTHNAAANCGGGLTERRGY